MFHKRDRRIRDGQHHLLHLMILLFCCIIDAISLLFVLKVLQQPIQSDLWVPQLDYIHLTTFHLVDLDVWQTALISKSLCSLASDDSRRFKRDP